jgi:hypothetical protein
MRHVGIIVSSVVFKGLAKGKFYYEEIPFYEEAGERYGLTPCYFMFEHISPERNELEAFLKDENGQFVLRTVPKPEVIHNRTFIWSYKQKRKIRKLLDQGIKIFNLRNRYPKLQIHEILNKNEELIPHLPETTKGCSANLLKMMGSHDELVIKPNNGTLGSGVAKLSRISREQWELSYYDKKSLIKERFHTEWPEKLKELVAKPSRIIQERIALAESKGGIFDLRVSVQKNEQGTWQVSGIVGKVAKEGSYLTNVAKGGSCHPLDTLLEDLPHLNVEKVTKDIEILAIKVARQLERELLDLADIGLDIGITSDGFPMFIECNCRDLRYSFRNANLIDEWRKTHETPVGYASYLYKQKYPTENHEAGAKG